MTHDYSIKVQRAWLDSLLTVPEERYILNGTPVLYLLGLEQSHDDYTNAASLEVVHLNRKSQHQHQHLAPDSEVRKLAIGVWLFVGRSKKTIRHHEREDGWVTQAQH